MNQIMGSARADNEETGESKEKLSTSVSSPALASSKSGGEERPGTKNIPSKSLKVLAGTQGWPQWQHAIDAEYDNLCRHNVFDLVEPPSDANIVGSKLVFRVKHDASDGAISGFKARFVAQGFTQVPGRDYHRDDDETFAPVSHLSSIRTILPLDACQHVTIGNSVKWTSSLLTSTEPSRRPPHASTARFLAAGAVAPRLPPQKNPV